MNCLSITDTITNLIMVENVITANSMQFLFLVNTRNIIKEENLTLNTDQMLMKLRLFVSSLAEEKRAQSKVAYHTRNT